MIFAVTTTDKAAGLYCAAVLFVAALGTASLKWYMETH